MITVMMLAYNEREAVEAAVQSFRWNSDVDISFVLVDNGSTDGLQEWATEQRDLTYVLLDGGPVGWGKAINMVKRELRLDTDLLIIEGHYMLTPNCLSRMVELSHQKEETGGVGGAFSEEASYEKAVELANENRDVKRKRAMVLHHGAILWKKEALEIVGEFDEEIETLSMVVGDYCLRMAKADKRLLICSNAFFWHGGNRNDIVYEKQWERDILEKKWGMHYFNSRYNGKILLLIDAEPDDKMNVLEIGCDCGATLLEIQNRYPNATVYGTEINIQAASIAAHFAHVTINNIEEENMPFHRNMFDYIIFGDVLEHLHNPAKTLRYCMDFLKEKGSIVASIPNVMHVSIMEQLLQGNFTYTETGILDRTHIHLFTCNEIIRTFCEAGYEITNMSLSSHSINDRQKRIIDGLLAIDNGAQRFMYETVHYLVKANKQINAKRKEP